MISAIVLKFYILKLYCQFKPINQDFKKVLKILSQRVRKRFFLTFSTSAINCQIFPFSLTLLLPLFMSGVLIYVSMYIIGKYLCISEAVKMARSLLVESWNTVSSSSESSGSEEEDWQTSNHQVHTDRQIIRYLDRQKRKQRLKRRLAEN